MSRRVVITGVGIVSPLGLDASTTWQQICAGTSAAKPIAQFDAADWPTNFACEVADFDLASDAYCQPQATFINRPNKFAMQATYEAMADARLTDYASDRFAISIGSGIGAIRPQDILNVVRELDLNKGFTGLSALLERSQENVQLAEQNHPGLLASLLSERWRAYASSTTFTTACAAGAQAIGYAARGIADGDYDIALAGGTDSLAGELLLAGFCLLGVLSKQTADPAKASRPFDKQRSGFVASEGAAILVLEERTRALARGASIYAEISGYGESENAYRITDLPPDGQGAIQAITQSLQNANLSVNDIDYINAHGTSTEQNDRVEALAIERVFYDAGAKPIITSTKSQIGHFVAAAGAVEAALSVLSLTHQQIPPTINLEQPLAGQKTELCFATQCIKKPLRYVLSNSFGFGGTNAALIFGAPNA